MIRSFFALALSVFALCSALTVRAEVPPRSEADLKETATAIVVGKVTKVSGTDKTTSPGHVDTIYTIEIAVDKVKKGKGLGKSVVATAWNAKKRPSGWVGPSGQYDIPKEGDAVTVYMTGKKGEFEAISPNGIKAEKK